MDTSVGLAVVGLLVNDEALRASADQRLVLGGFHGADLQGDAGELRLQAGDALLEVAV